jgi:N6-L-threonylcarbamoyladenine synthase
MPRILCIETTCDETAAAVVDENLRILGNVVASQTGLHQQFKGVVPEIAARAHVERILPVIDLTMRQSGLLLNQLDAIAIANTPGLSGSLTVGMSAAKALSLSLGIPLIAVNHLHAHIYAGQLISEESIYPCLGFVVSGGHTHLYHFATPIEGRLLGGTIDDAAGEAFDKVANMLRLPYPGGPAIAEAALTGNPKAYHFPRSFIHQPEIRFSFSGLKTAVRYAITGPGNSDPTEIDLSAQQVADLAASFQQAVVECLVIKCMQGLAQTGAERLCVGGGVAANLSFRDALEDACRERNVRLIIPPLRLCTDNAAMGAIAMEKFQAGLFESLDLSIYPGLVR